jgi:hypothetical protein
VCRVRPLVGFSKRVDCGDHYSVLFVRLRALANLPVTFWRGWAAESSIP